MKRSKGDRDMTQHLTEDHLDQLLAATAAPVRPEAQAAARELATLTRNTSNVPQRPHRRRRRLVAIAAVLALASGAGTLTAYELSIPPFQSLPDGISRVRPPIIVEFDGVDGQRHRCQVFPEFLNLTAAQDEAARAWASRQDWTGYGDQLAVGFNANTQQGQETQLLKAVFHDLRARFAEQMVPGVTLDPHDAHSSGTAGLAGSAGTCRAVPDAD